MPKLGVNIDHIATLREVRKAREPDPVFAAAICESAGAHGITVHLREDRRHIQERDVRALREKVATRLNLEMAATDAMVRFAVDLMPDMTTLVPERREELTTEGGLDVAGRLDEVTRTVSALRKKEIEVSLFIEPDLRQIEATLRSGAGWVEFHTGAFANAHDAGDETGWNKERIRLKEATVFARKNGLGVNMGHGLNYDNVHLVAAIEGVHEFNIGHSIIRRALFVGLERAVREMLELVD